MQRLFGANKMDEKIYNEGMKGLLHKDKTGVTASFSFMLQFFQLFKRI